MRSEEGRTTPNLITFQRNDTNFDAKCYLQGIVRCPPKSEMNESYQVFEKLCKLR